MVRGDKLKEFLKLLKMIDIYHIEKSFDIETERERQWKNIIR